MRGPAALVATLALILGGCVGGVDGVDEAAAPATAEKTGDTGGIEGTITDDEMVPIHSAQVGIAKHNQTATTNEGGSFALSRIEPGTHLLIAGRLGYFEATKQVTVVAGEITRVQMVLDRIPVAEPGFNETLKQRGSLLVNNLCLEEEPPTQGHSWQVFDIPVNATKPDGTVLAATAMNIEFRSEPNAATVDIDIHLFDPQGKQVGSGTQFAPNENIAIEKYLPAGVYKLHVCLYLGTQADFRITTVISYEQGEAAEFVKRGRK